LICSSLFSHLGSGDGISKGLSDAHTAGLPVLGLRTSGIDLMPLDGDCPAGGSPARTYWSSFRVGIALLRLTGSRRKPRPVDFSGGFGPRPIEPVERRQGSCWAGSVDALGRGLPHRSVLAQSFLILVILFCSIPCSKRVEVLSPTGRERRERVSCLQENSSGRGHASTVFPFWTTLDNVGSDKSRLRICLSLIPQAASASERGGFGFAFERFFKTIRCGPA